MSGVMVLVCGTAGLLLAAFILRSVVEAIHAGLAQRMVLEVAQAVLPPRRLDRAELERAICRRVLLQCGRTAGGSPVVPGAARVTVSRWDWLVLHGGSDTAPVQAHLGVRVAAEAAQAGAECSTTPVLHLVVDGTCRDGWPRVDIAGCVDSLPGNPHPDVDVSSAAAVASDVCGRMGHRPDARTELIGSVATALLPALRGSVSENHGSEDCTDLLDEVTAPIHGHEASRRALKLLALDASGATVRAVSGHRLVLGRSSTDVLSTAATVSAHHAVLEERDNGWWITDLQSTNGTLVNDRVILSSLLKPGDTVQLGGDTGPRFEMKLVDHGEAVAADTDGFVVGR